MTALAALAGKFRAQAAANVEYSIDHRPRAEGVTVPLGPHARQQIEQAGAAVEFGGSWAATIGRLIDAMLPNAMLLRFDSERGQLSALTAYLRFREEPDAVSLAALLARTSRLRIEAQPLAQIVTALACRGPRGLGIRGAPDGGLRLALYFKVEHDIQAFSGATVGQLLGACGWDDTNAKPIQTDLRALHPGGSVGVIGIDIGAAGDIVALKCDPANVPLERAAAFLRARHASAERIATLYAMSQALRALSLSYVGVKYTVAGCAGWRLYFSCRQGASARSAQPALLIDAPGAASLRMPHY